MWDCCLCIFDHGWEWSSFRKQSMIKLQEIPMHNAVALLEARSFHVCTSSSRKEQELSKFNSRPIATRNFQKLVSKILLCADGLLRRLEPSCHPSTTSSSTQALNSTDCKVVCKGKQRLKMVTVSHGAEISWEERVDASLFECGGEWSPKRPVS